MPKIDHLFEFVAVADAGSISGAARALGVPRATLSRRLTQLEHELQVKLMHREPRRLGLTHAGELLVNHARALLASAELAWDAVRQVHDAPRGRLRLSFPPTVLFSDLLLQFRRAFPMVEIQVIGTPRLVDLVAEGVDVAFRAGVIRAKGLVARRLWTEPTVLVASPEYLNVRGRPSDEGELLDHDVLVGFEEGWRPDLTLPLRAGGHVPVRSRFATQEVLTRLAGALDGAGMALLPSPLVSSYLESGQLETVLPEVVGSERPTSLVFPERQFLASPARAFIDFTVAFFASGPYPGGHRVEPRLLPAVVRRAEDD